MTKISSIKMAYLFLALASLSQFNLPANAAGPTKAFEATVENGATGSTSHQWSDGRGHMRSESNIGGVKRLSIMDFNTMTTYAINDDQKTITQMALTAPPGEGDPSIQWTPIGAKVIDGHPCQGKRANGVNGVLELWTGTDTGCTVLMTTNGKPLVKLKTWSAAIPSAALFSLPAGYKTIDMGAMMKKMQGMQAGGANGN